MAIIACYSEIRLCSIDFLVVDQIRNYFKIHYFTGLGRQLRATQLPGFAWVTTTITAGAPTSILKQLLTITGKKFNVWRFLINFFNCTGDPKNQIKNSRVACSKN